MLYCMLLLSLLSQAGSMGPRHERNQLVVKFREKDFNLTPYEVALECEQLTRKVGVKHVNILNAVKMCVVDMDSAYHKVLIKEALFLDAKVDDVSDDQVVTVDKTPNDSHWLMMQHLIDIDAPQAWDIFTGENAAQDTLVAIIDTGIDYTHPDLRLRMWENPEEIAGDGLDNDGNGYIDDYYGMDFSSVSGDPMDIHGHGTHCAGVVAAHGNNGMGVTGVMWGGVKLIALKFIGADGDGFVSNAIMALNYAYEKGAMISSNSWGGPLGTQAISHAISTVGEGGHLFVTASGNDGLNNDVYAHFPCNYECTNMLCVGSSSDGSLSSFSNFGALSVDLTAPGENIFSTVQSKGYGTMSGTSMSTPIVAGILALLKSFRPDLSGDQVKSILIDTLDHAPQLQSKTVFAGQVNAHKALLQAQQFTNTMTPVAENWTSTSAMHFNDTDDIIGTLDGILDVQFASSTNVTNVLYFALYFAREDAILDEIFRVNIWTDFVMHAAGGHAVIETAQSPRRLRSLHNVTANASIRHILRAPHVDISARRLSSSFQYRLSSVVQTGATHLALKIGNALGFSNSSLFFPLVDHGSLATPRLFSVAFEDTDVAQGVIAGVLSFTGPHAEKSISSYRILSGSTQLAEIGAHSMQVPICNPLSTHCHIVETTWRDDATFVLSRLNYGSSEYASYTFYGPGSFVFEFMDLELDYDYVKIGARTYTDAYTNSTPYTVPEGPITVVWHSDYSSQEAGFTLLFTPANHYSVSIPPISVNTLQIYTAYAGTMAHTGEVVSYVDLYVPLRVTFEDRNYDGGVAGLLRIEIFDARGEDVHVYFGEVLHGSYKVYRDSEAVEVQMHKAGHARVVLTDSTGVQIKSAEIELTDIVGQPPTAVYFGSDQDMRRDYIHGSVEVHGRVDHPKFVEYRVYSYGVSKVDYLGAIRPTSLAVNCSFASCVHLSTRMLDDGVVLDYINPNRTNYEGYEHLLLSIDGPGTLMPTYLDMEPEFDIVAVYRESASTGRKVMMWSSNEGPVANGTKSVMLGSGRYEIEWRTDYVNPYACAGWRLLWKPYMNNSIGVSLSPALDLLVVSVYGDDTWESEMNTGLPVQVEDWFVRNVECSETHMVCPLSEHAASVPYHILGAESESACQKASFIDTTGATKNWTGFRFKKEDCNTQRLWDFADQVIIDQVILIPSVTDTMKVSEMPPRPVLCQCESPISGNASSFLARSKTTETLILKSTNEFKPHLALYNDEAFLHKFGSNANLKSDHFYWEISSSYTLDVLAVTSCRASPTNDFTNEFAVDIIRHFCGQPHFEVQRLPSAGSSRFSMRAFHFAHQDELFLRCGVRRCDVRDTACGVCDDRRRLSEQADAEVTMWVRGVPTQNISMILDNTPPIEAFSAQDTDVWERLGGRTVQTRIYFTDSPSWLRACGAACTVVATAMECALANTLHVRCSSVMVTSIVERSRRRARHLNGGAEVAFSIAEPVQDSNVNAIISDMEAGGESLRVFANALIEEILAFIPNADISSISVTSLLVSSPIIAVEPGKGKPEHELPTLIEPVVFPSQPTSTTPPDRDGLLNTTTALLLAGSVAILLLSVFAHQFWKRRSTHGQSNVDYAMDNACRLDDTASWISCSLSMSGIDLEHTSNADVRQYPGVPRLPSLGRGSTHSVYDDLSVVDYIDDDGFTLDTISSPNSPHRVLDPEDMLAYDFQASRFSPHLEAHFSPRPSVQLPHPESHFSPRPSVQLPRPSVQLPHHFSPRQNPQFSPRQNSHFSPRPSAQLPRSESLFSPHQSPHFSPRPSVHPPRPESAQFHMTMIKDWNWDDSTKHRRGSWS